jgi:hypothetical protein
MASGTCYVVAHPLKVACQLPRFSKFTLHPVHPEGRLSHTFRKNSWLPILSYVPTLGTGLF